MTILIRIGNNGSTISINELILFQRTIVFLQKLCHFYMFDNLNSPSSSKFVIRKARISAFPMRE